MPCTTSSADVHTTIVTHLSYSCAVLALRSRSCRPRRPGARQPTSTLLAPAAQTDSPPGRPCSSRWTGPWSWRSSRTSGSKSDKHDGRGPRASAIASARSSFLPLLTAAFFRSSSRSVPERLHAGHGRHHEPGTSTSHRAQPDAAVARHTLQPELGQQPQTQDGGNPLFNPSLARIFPSTLRSRSGAGSLTDPNRGPTRRSPSAQRVNADVQLEQQIAVLDATVRNAYLDLISCDSGPERRRAEHGDRQNALANARARVAVGAAAPIELISAEADVASNQEHVLAGAGADCDGGGRPADADSRSESARLLAGAHRADRHDSGRAAADRSRRGAIENALSDRLDLAVLAAKHRDRGSRSFGSAGTPTRPNRRTPA